MKRWIGWPALVGLLATCLAAGACSREEPSSPAPAVDKQAVDTRKETAQVATEARIETSMGEMTLELYEEECPDTVANFMHLVSSGFYDGLVFHRVIKDFMIQGGCPDGTGRGGPGWRIADEFVNTLRHDTPGILSMANSGPNTNGSQFFITLTATPWLDDKHSVFGRVTDGADVLEKIGSVKTGAGDRPRKPITIQSIALYRDGQPLTGVQPKPKTF